MWQVAKVCASKSWYWNNALELVVRDDYDFDIFWFCAIFFWHEKHGAQVKPKKAKALEPLELVAACQTWLDAQRAEVAAPEAVAEEAEVCEAQT